MQSCLPHGRSLRPLAALASGLALAPATARASETSPAQLLHAARIDATARATVHDATVNHGRPGIGIESADVGVREGRQTFDLPGGEHARVLVVDRTAYVSGNRPALIHYFGFSATVARKIGASWVSIPASNPGYKVVARDVTLETFLADLFPAGRPTTTAPIDIGGRNSVGVHGTGPTSPSPRVTITATLYLSHSASPLPVREKVSDNQGDTASETLSKWGEHLTLKAPSDTIPISTLGQ